MHMQSKSSLLILQWCNLVITVMQRQKFMRHIYHLVLPAMKFNILLRQNMSQGSKIILAGCLCRYKVQEVKRFFPWMEQRQTLCQTTLFTFNSYQANNYSMPLCLCLLNNHTSELGICYTHFASSSIKISQINVHILPRLG